MGTLVEHSGKRVRFNPIVEVKEFVVDLDSYTGIMVLDHRGFMLTSSHDKSAVYSSYKLPKQCDIHNDTNMSLSESSDINMALYAGPLIKPNKNTGMSYILEGEENLPVTKQTSPAI